MRRTKTEALKTRQYLMLAALNTFYKKGVARSSLNEIAQTAGVTRGALYWHFKNKEDLFDALFHYIFKDFKTRLTEDIGNASPDTFENMRQALFNIFNRLQSDEIHRKFMSILHLKCEHTEQNQAIVNLMTQYNITWYEQLVEALTLCIKQKKLPTDLNVDLAATYIRSVCTGLTFNWLIKPDKFNLDEAAPQIVDTLLDSLQNSHLLRKQQA